MARPTQAHRGGDPGVEAMRSVLRAATQTGGDEGRLIGAVLAAAAPHCSAHLLGAALLDGGALRLHGASFGIRAGNPGSCTLTDAPIAQALGRPGVHSADAAALPGMVSALGGAHTVSVVALPGATRPLGVLIAADDGQAPAHAAWVLELTATLLAMGIGARRTEERLRRGTDGARSAGLPRSTVFSGLGHELRNPLSAIMGFAELLQLEDLGARQASYVINILGGAQSLSQLIDMVMEISRIESGALGMALEAVDLQEALRVGLDRCADGLGQQRFSAATLPATPEVHVLADAQRLPEVICSIALATIGRRAGAPLRVLFAATEPDVVRIGWVSPSDAGQVAAAELALALPHDALRARAVPVWGGGELRLMLVGVLVEAMQGTLGATDLQPGGRLRWMELRRTVPARESGHRGLPARSNTVVLLADGNLTNLRVMEQILAGRPGVTLLPAMLGAVALKLARAQRPDAILLDLHLPDMTGDAVLRELQHDRATHHIPVIMLTAQADSDRLVELRTLGAHACYTRPLNVESFLDGLDELLVAAPS